MQKKCHTEANLKAEPNDLVFVGIFSQEFVKDVARYEDYGPSRSSDLKARQMCIRINFWVVATREQSPHPRGSGSDVNGFGKDPRSELLVQSNTLCYTRLQCLDDLPQKFNAIRRLVHKQYFRSRAVDWSIRTRYCISSSVYRVSPKPKSQIYGI